MQKLTMRQWLLKVLLISVGTIINAYGVTLAIHAGFGGATLAVFWEGLSLKLGITLGQASFLVALLMLVFCFFYNRKQIQIGTILYQVIHSIFVDFFSALHVYSALLWLNFLLMLLGVVIQAFGTALYASADLGRGSYDALTFALSERNHWQVRIVRMCLDFILVVIGFLLGGKVGICTVVFILFSGVCLQFFLKQLQLFRQQAIKSSP